MKSRLINKKTKKNLIGCFVLFFFLTACNKKEDLKADHPIITQRLRDSVNYFIERYGLDRSIERINSQYVKIKDPGLGDQLSYLDIKLTAYYISINWNYSKAKANVVLPYIDSVIQLIEKNKVEKKYQSEYINAIFLKGDAMYYILNKHQLALDFYFKGKTLTDKLTNGCGKAPFSLLIALVYYREGKYRQATESFLQEYHQRCLCKFDYQNFAATQRVLNNIGLCYRSLNMPDSAMYYFSKTLVYIDKYGYLFPLNKRQIADAYGVVDRALGDLYNNKGDYEKAIILYKNSIKLTGHGGNEGLGAQLTAIELANLYLTTGRLKQADSVATDIELSLDTLPDTDAVVSWEKLKADYFNFLNKPKQGRPYLLAYLKLKKHADQVTNSMIANDVDSYFGMIQKTYDEALLNKQKQLNNLELILFIGFTLFILLITFEVWNNWRNTKKSNISLQTTLNALQQSQDENTRLLEIVAHDLRDPIGSIFAISSLLLDAPGESAYERKALELIKISGKNSLDLVDDLLKMNIEPQLSKKESVDLAEMLNYCVVQLKFRSTAKNQQLILKIQPCSVPGNPEKLWRVASNLISNAIKFSPNGSTINVTLEKIDAGALITVKDNGIGIPPEFKDKMFKMFSDTRRAGTAGEKAFGMGLAISKQIIDAHGGNIWFESEPGNGTTFYVELTL